MGERLPDDLAVRVERLSKEFRLPHEQVHTLKERAVHPFRRRTFDRLRALDDVSLEVARGEFFGIVGRNGSGKSTLMKCLAGIYRPDAGDIWLRGRMAPFIELGVGFNPELAAFDNVVVNAVMLGLSPAEARERFDDIVAFAELEEFVALKLKNYSSGMQVRLAFAVMVHVDADLLLIDEVLAVGDASFQQKCYETLMAAKAAGRTILLVSHDMGQVERFCDRAMLVERGKVLAIGPAGEVARRYHEVNFARAGLRAATVPAALEGHQAEEEGDGSVLIMDTWLQDGAGRRTEAIAHGSDAAFVVRVKFREDAEDPVFGFAVTDDRGSRVLATTSEWTVEHSGAHEAGEEATAAMSLPMLLAPGRYRVAVHVAHPGPGQRLRARQADALSFLVGGAHTGGGVVDLPHQFHVSPSRRVREQAAAERGAPSEAP
jgi:ABC-type polysaccharide/polyol phosphate transport system ATPase subunit